MPTIQIKFDIEVEDELFSALQLAAESNAKASGKKRSNLSAFCSQEISANLGYEINEQLEASASLGEEDSDDDEDEDDTDRDEDDEDDDGEDEFDEEFAVAREELAHADSAVA